jgi:hypothetical protein
MFLEWATAPKSEPHLKLVEHVEELSDELADDDGLAP